MPGVNVRGGLQAVMGTPRATHVKAECGSDPRALPWSPPWGPEALCADQEMGSACWWVAGSCGGNGG